MKFILLDFGPSGSGIAAELGISDDIGIINGTLSKSFGQMGDILQLMKI